MAWQLTNHVVTRTGSGTCHIEHIDTSTAFSRNTLQIVIDGFLFFVASWDFAADRQINIGSALTGGGAGTGISAIVADGSGSWSYSYECEVWEDHISSIPIPSPISRGGETQTPSRAIRLGFRPKLGGSYSLSFYGQSISGTITSGMVAAANPSDPQGVVPPEKCGYSLEGDASNVTAGGAPPISWSGTVNGQTIGGAPSTYTVTDSVSFANTCIIDATNTFTMTPTVAGTSYFQANLVVETPGTWEIRGGARNPTGDGVSLQYKAWGRKSDGTDVAIPVTLPTTISDRDGINLTYRTGATGFSGQLYLRPVIRGLALTLDTSDPATLAEVGTDTRVLFRTKKWNGPTISHASRITLDACDNATGWVGAALSGGHLDVASGTAEKAYTNLNAESGRYLAFKVDPSVSDLQLRITITTSAQRQVFFAKAGASGSFGDAVIDLCSVPPLHGVSVQDSRWPDPPANEDGGWGLNYIQDIKIEAAAAFTLAEIALVRQTPPVITCIQSEKGRFLTSGPTSPIVYTCATIEIDGRRAMEIPGTYGTSVLTPQKLSDLSTWFAGHPGFTVSVPSLSQWYHFPELSGLGGTGTDYYRREWTMTDPIPMQGGVDAVYAFAGAGDVLYEGASGGTTILNVDKVVRSSFTGSVLYMRKPNSGVTVTAKQGGTVKGTDTTDSYGIFGLTGDQDTAAVTVDLTAAGVTAMSGSAPSSQRTEHRAVFAIRNPIDAVAYDVGLDLTHWRSFVEGGTARVGLAANADLATWHDTDTGIVADLAAAVLGKTTASHRILLLTLDSGRVRLWQGDRGKTFGMPLDLTDGATYAALHWSSDHRWWAYWLIDNTISGALVDDSLNVIKGPFDTNLTAAKANKGFAVQTSPKTGGGRRIGLLYTKTDDSTVLVTSDDGKTFT